MAVKIGGLSFDIAFKTLAGIFDYMFHKRKVKIGNLSAFQTDKVIMGRSVIIKMVRAVSYPEPCNLTDIGKQSQIPLHCSQTDIGKRFAHIHIDNIRSRMVFSCGQKFFYGIPLFAML